MAEGQDYSSIGPLNAAASKEGTSLLGYVLLVMLVTVVCYEVVGIVSNMF